MTYRAYTVKMGLIERLRFVSQSIRDCQRNGFCHYSRHLYFGQSVGFAIRNTHSGLSLKKKLKYYMLGFGSRPRKEILEKTLKR